MGMYMYRVSAQRVKLTDGSEANVALYAYKPWTGWGRDTDARNSKAHFRTGCCASEKLARDGKFTGRFVIGHKDDTTGKVTVEPGSKAYAFGGGTFLDDAFFSAPREEVGETPYEPSNERTTFNPTPEQVEALRAFAGKYGHNWKHTLSNLWFNGRDDREPNGHLLRQVRNQGGPRWLAKYAPSK